MALPILLPPYLNEKLKLDFRLGENHFLSQLGKHFQEEAKEVKDEKIAELEQQIVSLRNNGRD